MWRRNVFSLQCDAAHLPLEDASVDLIVTSPPYWQQRSYEDGGAVLSGQLGSEESPQAYVDSLLACTREWLRVLKPIGSLFVNIGDKYAACNRNRGPSRSFSAGADSAREVVTAKGLPGTISKSLMNLPARYAIGCTDTLGLIQRAEIIWHKGMPESVRDRCRRDHELIYHFTKQGKYYFEVDRIREPHAGNGKGKTWQQRKESGEPGRYGDTGVGASGAMVGGLEGNQFGRLPSDVWDITTQPLNVPKYLAEDSLDGTSFDFDHYAAFPAELPAKIILGWSPSGGVVADPFGGTGTTAITAAKMGRFGITCDLSYDYAKHLVDWRMHDLSLNRRKL